MTWKDDFYEAVRVYCNIGDDCRVTSVTEENVSGGYCETCYYESTETHVIYIDGDGEYRTYISYLSISEFMNSL